MQQFFRCACFATDNIYLRGYDLHVKYTDRQQFWKDYEKELAGRGCDTEEKKRAVCDQIEAEITRRKQQVENAKSRREVIRAKYVRKHPEVYTLNEDYLELQFKQCVQAAKDCPDKVLEHLTVISPSKRLYSLPVFKPEFCDRFVDELENFERSDLPKERPNTMNRYGVLLSDLGFDEHFLNPLRENYLTPISKVLFPEWTGSKLDSHKAFTVRYEHGKEEDLSCHYDNAEVTLNVCLGKAFRGSEVFFCDMRSVHTERSTGLLVSQAPGVGILHQGQMMHGVLSILGGTRVNMIAWMRSSEVRNRRCPMCDEVPRLVAADGFGDGFTK